MTLTTHSLLAKTIYYYFIFSDNLTTKHDIHFEKFQKDGDTYMKATKYITKFTPQHTTLRFDNLFSGDTILGIFV